MPELPEVQATVDGLKRRIIGRRIQNIWTDWPKIIKDPLNQRRVRRDQVARARKFLKGEKILGLRRRGKNILVSLSGNKIMLIHQKMSGHLLVGKWRVKNKKVIPMAPPIMKTDPWNGHIRFLFYLSGDLMVAFSDLRRFGKIVLGLKKEIENLTEIKNLGPEPLAKKFTFPKFRKIISKQKRKIKPVLMDPYVIAGIGNIYSDDMLWQSKIHPLKPANTLKDKELKALYTAMKSVLQKAKKLKGTSKGDYRTPAGREGKYADSRLVYQREGESCKRCGTKIKRTKLAGRSAHFCPKCQRLESRKHLPAGRESRK